MAVITSAGTTLSIGAAPSTYNLAGFQAVSFTPIAEIVDLGSVGRVYNMVTHNSLSSRRTVKRKGSFDDGSVSVQLARETSDAGQIALRSASTSDLSYSFKIVLQDGSILYFTAQIGSFTTDIGSVDSITGATVEMAIDNDIIYA